MKIIIRNDHLQQQKKRRRNDFFKMLWLPFQSHDEISSVLVLKGK